MKVKNIGSNMAEVTTGIGDILVSHSTPVAACMADGSGFYRTKKAHSKTTSRHVSKWLNGAKAQERPQEFFDSLI